MYKKNRQRLKEVISFDVDAGNVELLADKQGYLAELKYCVPW